MLITTSSQTEGEGTRFFWIDSLTRISRLTGGVLKDFPLSSLARPIRARPQNSLTLPAALSGFRLTHLADPMRHKLVPRVHGSGLPVTAAAMTNSVFQIVKELHAAESGQRGGLFQCQNAKTPVMRF